MIPHKEPGFSSVETQSVAVLTFTLHPAGWNFLGGLSVFPNKGKFMKAYFHNLSTRNWLLLVVPAVALAYPLIRIAGLAVIHAIVPEIVRSVLSVM